MKIRQSGEHDKFCWVIGIQLNVLCFISNSLQQRRPKSTRNILRILKDIIN